ncbi:MAG: endonuclease/exonuclease/phosphatase family protein [Reyranellaceae bacterium]
MMSTVRVATYNVHSCIGGDRECNPERTVHVLREIDADILGLQEVGAAAFVDEADQFRYLEKHLDMQGIAGPTLRRGRARFGNAVLTRGKVLEASQVDLTVLSFEPRGAIDCLIELRGHTVRVISTHLGLLPQERGRQLKKIADMLEEKPWPLTVLLGDFNIFGPERRSLTRIGAPRQLPKLRSFPARRPLMSLDRVWTVPNHALVDTRLHRTTLSRIASDHLPVVGEIDLGRVETSASLHAAAL